LALYYLVAYHELIEAARPWIMLVSSAELFRRALRSGEVSSAAAAAPRPCTAPAGP
jgi:hypothetical protein